MVCSASVDVDAESCPSTPVVSKLPDVSPVAKCTRSKVKQVSGSTSISNKELHLPDSLHLNVTKYHEDFVTL